MPKCNYCDCKYYHLDESPFHKVKWMIWLKGTVFSEMITWCDHFVNGSSVQSDDLCIKPVSLVPALP